MTLKFCISECFNCPRLSIFWYTLKSLASLIMTIALFMLGVILCACQFIVICNFIYQLLFLCMFLASIIMLFVDVLKPGLGLLCLLNLLLQDAPLSDCTESIEGLDLTEQAFSPAKSLSVRKVLPCHTALNTVIHPSFYLFLTLTFSLC